MSKVKILQINVWTGRIKDGLSRFIAEGDYDVVCMQEAIWEKNQTGLAELFTDPVDKIKTAADFPYDFRSSNYGIELLGGADQLEQGNVILSKIPFAHTEEKLIHGQYAIAKDVTNFREAISDHSYTAQKVRLKGGLTIVNYHGYWLPNPIGDETTVLCMGEVAKLLNDEHGAVVMCGDLNVTAESPAMRELDFLEDLTATHKIKTTLRNVRFVKDVACDHVLIGGGAKCDDFRVIDKPVSDHQVLEVVIDF